MAQPIPFKVDLLDNWFIECCSGQQAHGLRYSAGTSHAMVRSQFVLHRSSELLL